MTNATKHARESSNDPLLGRRLGGRYRLVHCIANGSMARIYEARDDRLDRRVAVKVLGGSEVNARNHRFRKRFVAEARFLSQLSDPNTVGVLDFGQDGQHYFIAMEFVEGRTLRDVVDHDGPLDPLRVVALGVQVCRSLAQAHAKGVLHRDLKPSNLMVTRHPEGREHILLLDFGIAKLLNGGESLTQEGTLLGSPGYMSPEQILAEPLTTRSDIYNVGALLYYMCTGRPPFHDGEDGLMTVLYRHLNEEAPPFRVANEQVQVPECIESVTRRCLEKAPEHRFESALEVSKALQDCEQAFRLSAARLVEASKPPDPRATSSHSRQGAPHPLDDDEHPPVFLLAVVGAFTAMMSGFLTALGLAILGIGFPPSLTGSLPAAMDSVPTVPASPPEPG